MSSGWCQRCGVFNYTRSWRDLCDDCEHAEINVEFGEEVDD